MEIFTRWQDPTIEEYKQLIKNWKEKYYQMKEERNKQKEVLDKIKEYCKNNLYNTYQTLDFEAGESRNTAIEELLKLLEEIE